MRAADPFWEAKRPVASCMYQARVNTQGQINTTCRMEQWLHELPDPEPRPEPQPPKTGVQNIRPRSMSALAPPPGHTPRPAASPTPGVADQSPIKRFHHPNPLSQHPVQLEELPPPFKVPQRKSSLRHTLRVSQLSPPPYTLAHQQSELVKGVQQIQLGEPVEFRGTRELADLFDKGTDINQICNDLDMADLQQDTAGSRSASVSKRHTVQFGEMLQGLKGHLPMDEIKKHDRSEVSNLLCVYPTPRMRERVGLKTDHVLILDYKEHYRDRKPAAPEAPERPLWIHSKPPFSGRHPSPRQRAGRAQEQCLDHDPRLWQGIQGPPWQACIWQFQESVHFPNHISASTPKLTKNKEGLKIRVAFIGDGHCGKTSLLQYVSLEQPM